jgi:hypothetical protein
MVVDKVYGGQTHCLPSHMARTAGPHLVNCHLGQVGGAPPWPYKIPPLSVKVDTHTHTTFWRFYLQSYLS